MTGYSFNSRCFETTNEALQAFNQSFPVIGQSIVSLETSSITGNQITYSLKVRPVTEQTDSIITGTIVLPQCELEPVFDSTIAAGIWSGCFIWILTLYIISKNAGVILEAIRKF